MHGLMPMSKELRKKRIREEEIVEGLIATAGGVVAFALISVAPAILVAIVGKLALDRLKREISRDMFFDPYDEERRG